MEPDRLVKNDHKVENKLDCKHLGLIPDSKFLFQNFKKRENFAKIGSGI